MPPLESAVKELRQTLVADPTAPEWRWNLRRRLSEVKEALSGPAPGHHDAWLAARDRLSTRERITLQARVTALAAGILERLDDQSVAQEVRRLLSDLEHHVQRVHDLVYDSVSLELGGSE